MIGLFSFICAFIFSNIVLFFIKNVDILQGYVILKKIVDIHKGEITIKSEENKETTVTLSFNNK